MNYISILWMICGVYGQSEASEPNYWISLNDRIDGNSVLTDKTLQTMNGELAITFFRF